MARAIWKGSIAFGLVNVPVELHGAEDPHEISFHQLDKKDFSPIGYKRINKATGREVAWEDIVRGMEVAKDSYVVLTDAELEAAHPEATHTIDLVAFVEQSAIDPLQFDKPYYLAPSKAGRKAYALLREALMKKGLVGIGRVVIRTRQHLAAIIPKGDVMTLVLLRFASEIRSASDLDVPHGTTKALAISPKELEMAERLVDSMTVAWDPKEYDDDYRAKVMALVEEKEKAGEVNTIATDVKAPRAKPTGKVVDLMALLQKSVEANVKPNGHAHGEPAKAKRRRAPAHHAKRQKTG
jgi:DNA end-binding protein Ku